MSDEDSGSRENFRFQTVIVIIGSFLLIAKFIAYFMTNSVAILTDAMESIINVVAGSVGLYALYISPKPPDKDHPYGHGRAEVISAAFEGALILLAGVIIIFSAIRGIQDPTPIASLDFGILIIFLAALVNLVMGRAAIRIGRKNRSQALEASGRHIITDTLDSFGIIIGLLAIYIGPRIGYDIAWLDPILAMLFGAIILSTGLKVLKGAVDTIMDRVDPETVSAIADNIIRNRHENWIDIHGLRVKKYGTGYIIDLHVTLPKYMTVGETEKEVKKMLRNLRGEFGENLEMNLKTEPCRDFSCSLCFIDCDVRKSDFIKTIDWTKETIVKPTQHRLKDE